MRQIVFFFTLASLLSAQTFDSIILRLEQSPVEQRKKIIESYLNSRKFSPIIEQDSILHFVLYGEADSVAVTGNLQRWRDPFPLNKIPCGEFSFFYSTFVIPPDARLDYQLIVNGKFITDPQNPRITPSGFGPHSEVRMPRFIPTPYLYHRSDIPHGVIDSLAPLTNIPSPLNRYLAARRPVKIYRPAGYDTLADLPSVYIHDGFEAIDFAFAPAVLDNLIAEGRIPPVIAVFIPPVERQDEYLFRRRDQFVSYLCDELVPLVDHLYRTSPVPQNRAVMGISNGGHIAVYSLFKRPDIFRNAGGQSSTVTPWLYAAVDERHRMSPLFPEIKLYLDCGTYDIIGEDSEFGTIDFLEMNRSFSRHLSSLRIPHYFKAYHDGHEWASWRERIPEMFVYFFGK